MTGATDSSNIRVLDRALAVLNALVDFREDAGVTEIASTVALSKATVHRLLVTLEAHRVVLRTENGRYRMGSAPLLWAETYRRQTDLVTLAKPVLKNLLQEVGETIHLSRFQNGETFYLDKLESSHPVGMRSRIGATLAMYCTAAGRAILASLPQAELDLYLRSVSIVSRTERTLVTPKELLAMLGTVRERGWAEENQENEEGIRCVGAAILNAKGYPVGALSISAPAYRFADDQLRPLGEKVLEAALAISKLLGYDGVPPSYP